MICQDLLGVLDPLLLQRWSVRYLFRASAESVFACWFLVCQLTHINLAADLIVGDEGCASRKRHAHFGHTPCDNCKWDDHAGTTVIALDV